VTKIFVDSVTNPGGYHEKVDIERERERETERERERKTDVDGYSH
jgi:hypothetical protein